MLTHVQQQAVHRESKRLLASSINRSSGSEKRMSTTTSKYYPAYRGIAISILVHVRYTSTAMECPYYELHAIMVARGFVRGGRIVMHPAFMIKRDYTEAFYPPGLPPQYVASILPGSISTLSILLYCHLLLWPPWTAGWRYFTWPPTLTRSIISLQKTTT